MKKQYKCNGSYKEALLCTCYPYIYDGYRVNARVIDCIKSVFQWHTETVNIWTMIFASVLSCHMFTHVDKTVNRIPFALLTGSVLIHAPFSLAYHTFMPVNTALFYTLRKLDITFILVSSVMMCFSMSYCVFSLPTTIMLTCLSLFVSTKAIVCKWQSKHGHCIEQKTTTLLILPAIGIYMFPMIYHVAECIFRYKYSPSVPFVFFSIASLSVGAISYIYQIPEKWYPGRFNCIGHSHTIMHVGIIGAHIGEYMFVHNACKK